MRIAVISDTHDRLPGALLQDIVGADEIWHLGDVVEPEVLAGVRSLGRPTRIVRGNCDWCADWPWALDFEIEGFAIHLVHIPPTAPPPGAALILHGHTHVPRYESRGGVLFLNPGCITRPNRGAPASYAWLELRHGREPNWEIIPAPRLRSS